jgi:glycosyltransferase involved in cell wall biosynthesis
MRVLMITPSYFPIKGGAETLVRNLTNRLNRMGIDADIMTFNMNQKWKPNWQAKREKDDDIEVYRIPGLNWFPLIHSDRVTQGINLIPGRFRKDMTTYDILHFHVGDLSLPLFSFGVGKQRILHFHGNLDSYKRNILSRLTIRKTAELYIAVSHKIRCDLADIGVQESKIRYLPNAVDPAVFHSAQNKDENLLLFVGRITFSKGLHILLNSLSRIKTKIHLVIIGPSDWDIEYFHKIENRINKENAKGFHRITYLGQLGEAAIAKWLGKASVFVLPSYREAFGISILEALSSETPVVATNISGIREAVIHGENGFLISKGNSSELASHIQYLLDHETVRADFGRKGRKRVVERFSYGAAIENLVQIYKELILN